MTIKDQDALLPFDEIFHATCMFCGNAIDIRRDDVYQQIAGWFEIKEGDRHSTAETRIRIKHSIITERVNRWAHQDCVEREIAKREATSRP